MKDLTKGIFITLALLLFALGVSILVFGQPPDHVWDRIPEDKRPAVESIIALRGRQDEQELVAYLNRITVEIMNPVWAREKEIDKDEVDAVIEASTERYAERVRPALLILTEIDFDILELLDIGTISLMLAELSLAEIRTIPIETISLIWARLSLTDIETLDIETLEVILSRIDLTEIMPILLADLKTMPAVERTAWLMASRRVSRVLTAELAGREIISRGKDLQFIVGDYDKVEAGRSNIVLFDGTESDLLSFQQGVTNDTELIVLNWQDGGLYNYRWHSMTEDDYKTLARNIRARMAFYDEMFPDIPKAVMVTVGRGDTDLKILDMVGFQPDTIAVTGISNPEISEGILEAIAGRYKKYSEQVILMTMNEGRGYEYGGEVWGRFDERIRDNEHYVGYVWMSHATRGRTR